MRFGSPRQRSRCSKLREWCVKRACGGNQLGIFQEMERRGKINFIVIMKHVSVSYCYITNYPRTMWLQNTNIYYLTQFLNVRNLGVR